MICDSRISISIPTYNNGLYIEKTLESVLGQTYGQTEIIVNDNVSTDNTKNIVLKYQNRGVKYFNNELHVNCAANWNNSIRRASHDIVALYHSDDIYEKSIVEKEIELLNSSEDIGAVFCLDRLIDENDDFLRDGVRLPKELRKPYNVLGFQELLIIMLKYPFNLLVAPTLMVKKKVFQKVGFFDETETFGKSIGGAADTEFWLRMAQCFKIGILSERLIRRRLSTTQGSLQYEHFRVDRANHFLVLDEFLKKTNNIFVCKNSIIQQYALNKIDDDIIIAMNFIYLKDRVKARDILFKRQVVKQIFGGGLKIANLKITLKYIFVVLLLMLRIDNNLAAIVVLYKKIFS